MKISDRLYDVLKWVVLVVIPALATCYVALSAIWGWPYADEIAKTAAAVCTLLGALLGISTAQYNKDEKKPPDYDWEDDTDTYDAALVNAAVQAEEQNQE